MKKDPYFLNGLVKGHKIRPWTVVVGSAAPSQQEAAVVVPNEEGTAGKEGTSQVSGMTGFARATGTFERYIFTWEVSV